MTHDHPDHSGVLPNLNRAKGQLDGVAKMIEERRYCPEILTQLKAARSALKSIEAEIFGAHVDCCVKQGCSAGSLEQKLDEIKEIFKKCECC